MAGFGEIFIVSLILFIVFRRPIMRFLGRILAKKIQKAAAERGFQYQQFQQEQRAQQHRDGETFISKKKAKKGGNSVDPNEGEYIDYEEIK